MDINKLLKPRKIVIIGASEKEGFGSRSTQIGRASCRERV